MKNMSSALSAVPNSLWGGFLIVLLFMIVFMSVYIARSISVAISERINRSVADKKAPTQNTPAPAKRHYNRKLSPALQSALKKPTKTIYISERED